MKTLSVYILEQELETLKKTIISNIQQSSNEKLLKKINKFFELSDDEFENADKFIKQYFMDRCGYNNKITSNLMMKIKHYGAIGLCNKLFNIIENSDNVEDIDFLTVNKILQGNNLFDLIKNFAKSVLKGTPQYNEIDDEFNELIKSIADFDIGGKTAIGKMEFLTSMFLKDLNKRNKPEGSNRICDINAGNIGLEYKVSGGRISGNNSETKPKNSEVMTKKFREIINKELRNNGETDNLDEKITNYINLIQKQNNLFRNGKEKTSGETGIQLEKVLEPLFEFGFSQEKINNIVIDCLLEQLNNFNINNSERKYLLNNYPVINERGEVNETGKNNFKQMFLILHLCHYCSKEKWNYLILFDKNSKGLTGEYKIVKAVESNDITLMAKQLEELNISSSAFPCYGDCTNDQNQAPMIKYNK